MAILSNINDKFAVDSTGAIQFNGQAGTSGYVLKSNGNAAPTWVDASTVIGGPYLPLSGGTLTGATATASGISFTVGGVLNGTSATFAGNVRISKTDATLEINNSTGSLTNADLYISVEDTGQADVRQYGAYPLAFWTNNVERMRITSGGDVGIGAALPAGKFEIKSAASNYTTAPAITFTDDTGVADSRWILGNIATNYGNFVLAESDSATTVNYSPRITVIPGGNVGIGTTSPNYQLEVRTTTNNRAIQAVNSTTSGTNWGFQGGAYGSGATKNIGLQVTAEGASTNYAAIFENGNVGIGTTTPASTFGFSKTLEIQGAANAEVNISQSDNGKDWSLGITDGANYQQTTSGQAYIWESGGTERMRITSDGMVGIGMTPNTAGASTYMLQMYNPGSQCFLSIGNGTSGNGPVNGLVIGNDASNAYIVNREATSLIFATSDANRMTILAGGNVGIGTTLPDNKLTVKAANCIIDSQSTADSQTIGFRAGYLNSATLCGFFRYTTADAQLYIDNEFVGNNGVYSDINFRNKTTGGVLTNRIKIKGSTGNVGIGTDSPGQKLEVIGNISSGLSSTTTRTALIANTFGYSTSWKTLTLGSAGTNYQTDAVSLCFNVILNQNSSGLYSGDGSEYFWRNTGSFKTPNSDNNGYNTILSWNSSGQPYFSNNVGIGVTGPLSPLSIQANSGGGALRFVGRSDGISGIDFFNSTQTVGNYFQSNGTWIRSRADGGFHFSKGSTPITTDVDGFTIEGMNVGIGTDSPSGPFHVKVGTSTPLIVASSSYCNNVGIRTTTPTASLQVKGNVSYSYNNYTNVANTWINVINFSGYPAGLYQISIIKKTNASTYITAIVKWSATAGTVINTIASNQLGITFSGTQLQAISGIATGTLMSANLQCLVTNEDFCS
jgi:hypothetical protein